MNSLDKAKQRARAVRAILQDYSQPITHTNSLEIHARLEGFRDWNTYAAHLNGETTLLPLPCGWHMGGDAVPHYDAGVASGLTESDQPVATIRSKQSKDYSGTGFATLMQSIDAEEFIGERVQFTASLKAVDCSGAVTLWMRVDDVTAGNMLAFDNMENRETNGPLCGSTGWESRRIVLEVPRNAQLINYGFYLRGLGTAFATDVQFSTVSKDVELTNVKPIRPSQPVNLDFSETESK